MNEIYIISMTLKVFLKVQLHFHTICLKKIIKNMIYSILLKIWCIQEPNAKIHLKFGNLLIVLTELPSNEMSFSFCD